MEVKEKRLKNLLGTSSPKNGSATPVTLIVGMGRTGLSCARHLRKQGANIVITDSRESPPMLLDVRQEFPEVHLHLGEFQPSLFENASRVVVSPGVSLTEPAIEAALHAGKPVFGDIELFATQVRAPIAAITGSNGKSTVTTLLARMASQSGRRIRSGGNLGPPALDLLGDETTDLYVVEISSFQLETTSSLAPVVSTVLNISPDHMDRYPSLEAYAAAKQRVYRGNGAMVINRDDEKVVAMMESGRPTFGFTLGPPSGDDFGVRDNHLCQGQKYLLPIEEVGLKGDHNIKNVLAALAMGTAIDLNYAAMVESLKQFTGLPHRCELVAHHRGIRWLNDSKATNIGATVAAVKGLSRRAPVVLIAGGEGKGADFFPLREALDQTRVVILIGRDAKLIEHAIKGACPIYHADSLRQAVTKANALARCGDCVLLSPACASFDMFESYEARGIAFKALVRECVL